MEKIAGLQDHWCGKRRQPILHFPRPAGQASRFTHCMRICGRDRGLIGLGNLEENPEVNKCPTKIQNFTISSNSVFAARQSVFKIITYFTRTDIYIYKSSIASGSLTTKNHDLQNSG